MPYKPACLWRSEDEGDTIHEVTSDMNGEPICLAFTDRLAITELRAMFSGGAADLTWLPPVRDDFYPDYVNYTSFISANNMQFYAANAQLEDAPKRTGGVYTMTAFEDRGWRDITRNLPNSHWYGLQMDKAGLLYAATGDHGVWVLPRGGRAWQAANAGLEGGALHVNQFRLINDTPYIATDAGVYVRQS